MKAFYIANNAIGRPVNVRIFAINKKEPLEIVDDTAFTDANESSIGFDLIGGYTVHHVGELEVADDIKCVTTNSAGVATIVRSKDELVGAFQASGFEVTELKDWKFSDSITCADAGAFSRVAVFPETANFQLFVNGNIVTYNLVASEAPLYFPENQAAANGFWISKEQSIEVGGSDWVNDPYTAKGVLLKVTNYSATHPPINDIRVEMIPNWGTTLMTVNNVDGSAMSESLKDDITGSVYFCIGGAEHETFEFIDSGTRSEEVRPGVDAYIRFIKKWQGAQLIFNEVKYSVTSQAEWLALENRSKTDASIPVIIDVSSHSGSAVTVTNKVSVSSFPQFDLVNCKIIPNKYYSFIATNFNNYKNHSVVLQPDNSITFAVTGKPYPDVYSAVTSKDSDAIFNSLVKYQRWGSVTPNIYITNGFNNLTGPWIPFDLTINGRTSTMTTQAVWDDLVVYLNNISEATGLSVTSTGQFTANNQYFEIKIKPKTSDRIWFKVDAYLEQYSHAVNRMDDNSVIMYIGPQSADLNYDKPFYNEGNWPFKNNLNNVIF